MMELCANSSIKKGKQEEQKSKKKCCGKSKRAYRIFSNGTHRNFLTWWPYYKISQTWSTIHSKDLYLDCRHDVDCRLLTVDLP